MAHSNTSNSGRTAGSPVAKRPTRKRLDEWAELEQQRLETQRRLKSIEALQEPIEKEALRWAQHNADATRVVVCCDYRLELASRRASVKWKDEFVRVTNLDAAETIIAAQPTYETLKIHPPAK